MLFSEAAAAVFNFDNRLWHTLKQLLLQPGALTVAYLCGERVRYVSPLRLYLVFSVVYFFVVSLVGTTNFLFFKFDVEGGALSLGVFYPA